MHIWLNYDKNQENEENQKQDVNTFRQDGMEPERGPLYFLKLSVF